MGRFAVFVYDPEYQRGRFIDLARVDVDGDNEADANKRAIELHAANTGRSFTIESVLFCAALRELPNPRRTFGGRLPPRD